jgi:hypothetical protein
MFKKIVAVIVVIAAMVVVNLGFAQAAAMAPADAGLNWKSHKGYYTLVMADQQKQAYQACFNSTEAEVDFEYYLSEVVEGAAWVSCR